MVEQVRLCCRWLLTDAVCGQLRISSRAVLVSHFPACPLPVSFLCPHSTTVTGRVPAWLERD